MSSSLRIAGAVVDVLGHPIACARVVLRGDEREVLAETETGVDGAFAFQRDGSGSYVLEAMAAGKATNVVGTRQWTYARRIELPESVALRGRVTDEAGVPLPNVEVVAEHERWWGTRQSTWTNADGCYAFAAVPIGTIMVMAYRRGCQLLVTRRTVVTDSVLDLCLARAHQRAFQFSIVGATRDQLQLATCHFSRREGALPDSCCRGKPDADGIWYVDGLPNDSAFVDFQVSIPGMTADPLHNDFGPDPHSGCVEFEFTMTPTVVHEVRGRLLEESGAPLSGAVLDVGAIYDDHQQVVTGVDGRFTFTTRVPNGQGVGLRLAPGSHAIEGSGRGQPHPTRRRVQFVNMPWVGELTVHAVPAAVLRGRCVAGDGVGIDHAEVELLRHDPRTRKSSTSLMATTQTDLEGRFVFAGLNARPGYPVFVQLRRFGWRARSDEIVLLEGQSVDLPPLIAVATATVEGVLRDATGRALSGVQVTPDVAKRVAITRHAAKVVGAC